MTTHNDHSPNIAYFAMRRTLDNEGHIGAVLVVDAKGIPQEFRFTLPVRPSAIQTALYGPAIQDFITLELCGQQVVGALTTGPVACIVESESVLTLQEYADIPVIHVQRIGPSRGGDSGTARRAGNSRRTVRKRDQRSNSTDRLEDADNKPNGETPEGYVRLDSLAGFVPVLVAGHPDSGWIMDDYIPDLESLFSVIDLVEPFERITAGCQLLCEQDERFK